MKTAYPRLFWIRLETGPLLALALVILVVASVAQGCAVVRRGSAPSPSYRRPATQPPPRPQGPTASPDQVREDPTFRPYTQDGRTYYPLATGAGYAKEGVASWYGRKFHGRKTSNGETYNMYQLTCAHKTLPMNTWLDVTNLENGRRVRVRVNDRGPFVADRIIDLSYKAAADLGMVGAGTARVRVASVGAVPGSSDPKGPRDFNLRGRFYVQVGSYREKPNAQQALNRLLSAGYAQARMQRVRVAGVYYWRVQAGEFASLVAARKALASLSGRHPGAFIVADG